MCRETTPNRPQQYLLLAMQRLGPLYPSQFKRLLCQGCRLEPFGLMQELTLLKDAGLAEQAYDLQGLRYGLTPAGAAALQAAALSAAEQQRFDALAAQYAQLFEREKDYLAQYTEQANCVFPVFLSIRRGDAVVFHLDVMVDTEEEARRIAEAWPGCAEQVYAAVWGNIAPWRRPGGNQT